MGDLETVKLYNAELAENVTQCDKIELWVCQTLRLWYSGILLLGRVGL